MAELEPDYTVPGAEPSGWRCKGCGHLLAMRDHGTVTLWGFTVMLSDEGAAVQCPRCRTWQPWHFARLTLQPAVEAVSTST